MFDVGVGEKKGVLKRYVPAPDLKQCGSIWYQSLSSLFANLDSGFTFHTTTSIFHCRPQPHVHGCQSSQIFCRLVNAVLLVGITFG